MNKFNFAIIKRQLFWLIPLGWLWFRLFEQLHVEWSLNPQYSYGYGVPVLCAILLWKRRREGETAMQKSQWRPGVEDRRRPGLESGVLWALAAAWLPVRLVEEANPEWRLVSWAMALDVVGITWLLLPGALESPPCVKGPAGIPGLPFVLGFFLVAVPWPTVVEQPVVQTLARINTRASVEVLNLLGVPALAHGNIIEVGKGAVGIEEACSGIRSLQATLMVSLFLGEWHGLGGKQRGLCVAAGLGLSLLLNLARTVLLTGMAAREGVEAMGVWHDRAGFSVVLGCLICLWGLGFWMGKGCGRGGKGRISPGGLIRDSLRRLLQSRLLQRWGGLGCGNTEIRDSLRRLLQSRLLQLCMWLAVAEGGTAWWYWGQERGRPAAVSWEFALPRGNGSLREAPLPSGTRQTLRYDEGIRAFWEPEPGVLCEAIFLKWNPGGVGAQAAASHSPDVCLAAGGRRVEETGRRVIGTKGLRLAFREYAAGEEGERAHVFYCFWEDRWEEAGGGGLGYRERLRAVLEGRRNGGRRSLEVALWGCGDQEEAERVLAGIVESGVR